MSRILVAISLPRHPTTGNLYRDPAEATAFSMALKTGVAVEVVHVSDTGSPTDLKVYAGLGASRLVWIRSADPLAALLQWASDSGAVAVLTGKTTAQGIGSGTLSYSLAKALGWPVLADLRSMQQLSDGWSCETALDHGRRATWETDGPFVGSVGHSTDKPDMPRYSIARGESVTAVDIDCSPPARPRLADAARRATIIDAPNSRDYAERLRSLLAIDAGDVGRAIESNPEELANLFLDDLRNFGISKKV